MHSEYIHATIRPMVPFTEDNQLELDGVDNVDTDAPIRDRTGHPWNPDQIRIATKPYSLRHICDMIDSKDLNLEPDFQRADIWKPKQKSQLIESILLRIPLPSFYFDEASDGFLQVVDGVQRLTAIHQFARHEMLLSDLQYLKKLENEGYNDLAPTFRRRFDGTQIFVNVIDPQTPARVKFDIFRRINTGGTPLSHQEIRHCMSGDTARTFLKRCAALDVFQHAIGNAKLSRMMDKELVLRFYAFHQPDWANVYQDKDSLDEFLLDMTNRIDGASALDLEREFLAFSQSMENAFQLFNGDAFRIVTADGRRFSLNRSLFESWAVTLADIEWKQIQPRKEEIRRETVRRMNEDQDYISSFKIATTDLRRVVTRFKVAKEIVLGGGRD